MCDDLNKVMTAMLKNEIANTKKLIVICIILTSAVAASFTLNMILIRERTQYDKIVTEEYEYEVEGDENTLINGSQYNDNSAHNEGGGVLWEKQKAHTPRRRPT